MEGRVIKLGGSLIVPDEIDVDYLAAFRDCILRHVEDMRFYIITGGGATARRYINAAREIGLVVSEDLDWLGVHATRDNAHLMRTIFRKVAHPEIITNSTSMPWPSEHPVLIAGGWRPGWSTDYVAVQIATAYQVREVITLSNIDYVYDKDPKEHDDAKPLTELTWADYRAMIGSEWTPGMNAPFDPIASGEAQWHRRDAIIAGRDLENLDKIITG